MTNGDPPMIFIWDFIRGLRPYNDRAIEREWSSEEDCENNPVAPLVAMQEMPEQSVMIYSNAQRFIGDGAVMQAIWNLRDSNASQGRTLILLGTGIDLPSELRSDVVSFDDPLPTEEELKEVVQERTEEWHGAHAAEDIKVDWEASDKLTGHAATALKGCSRFAAEQLTSLAMTRDEFSMDDLRHQSRRMIEQTRGLYFEMGDETFDDIGGLDFAKEFGRRYFEGPRRPAVVVRVEELEKSMAGTEGDLSGTSGDSLQVILSAMEDNGWNGILAYGAPGAGKSIYAKSLANSHGALPMRFDVNDCKGSLVGQSERQIRDAMKVIETIGGDRVFFIASVNKLENLPPELQRRFRSGVWFFDAPGEQERATIWDIQLKAHGIEAEDVPDEDGLTGADIRNICEMAHALNCSLKDALRFVVPLKKQSPNAIANARKNADGKFISANTGGAYRMLKSTSGRVTKAKT